MQMVMHQFVLSGATTTILHAPPDRGNYAKALHTAH